MSRLPGSRLRDPRPGLHDLGRDLVLGCQAAERQAPRSQAGRTGDVGYRIGDLEGQVTAGNPDDPLRVEVFLFGRDDVLVAHQVIEALQA